MPPAESVAPRGSSRRDPKWLWIAAGALLVARIATGIYEEKRPPIKPDLVFWVPAAEAPSAAAATGKPIFYDFSADWCGPCQNMSREVFEDPKLAAAVSSFVVPVHVVDRQREEGHNSALVDSLQRAYAVTAFPTLVIAGADGKMIANNEGYPGAQPFMRWLEAKSLRARTGPGGALTHP